MRSGRLHFLATAAVLSLILVAGALADEPYFTGLGDLDGGEFFSWAWGVSPHGKVITGYSRSTEGPENEAFIWTAETGMVGLGVLGPEGAESRGYDLGILSDATVVISGWTSMLPDWFGGQPFRWTEGDGMVGLGWIGGGGAPPDGFGGWSWDISGDGKVIVGYAPCMGWEHAQAFRWSAETGMVGLGTLAGGEADPYSSAIGTNWDGSVITGESYNGAGDMAFRWTEEDGMVPLGTLGGGHSAGREVSPDGTVIVGQAAIDPNNCVGMLCSEGFRWTAETGMESLGTLQAETYSYAEAVSNPTSLNPPEGDIIVGTSGSTPVAFIWTRDEGMRDLKMVLETEYGFDLGNWQLQRACGITPDGLTIVGKGINESGGHEAWMVYLGGRAPCPDLTGDERVGLADLAELLGHYGETGATFEQGDLDGDGDVDLADLAELLGAYGDVCL